MTRLLRASLQRARDVTVLFAGSIEHLMRDLFAPSERALSQFGAFHELSAIAATQWAEGIRARFADDDATITPDALERLVALGEGHPRVTMLLPWPNVRRDAALQERLVPPPERWAGCRVDRLRRQPPIAR